MTQLINSNRIAATNASNFSGRGMSSRVSSVKDKKAADKLLLQKRVPDKVRWSRRVIPVIIRPCYWAYPKLTRPDWKLKFANFWRLTGEEARIAYRQSRAGENIELSHAQA